MPSAALVGALGGPYPVALVGVGDLVFGVAGEVIYLGGRITANGTVVIVKSGLSEMAATALAERPAARGHKRAYRALLPYGGADRAPRLWDFGGGCVGSRGALAPTYFLPSEPVTMPSSLSSADLALRGADGCLVRDLFPLLAARGVAYLDHAASAQKPVPVLDA